MDGRGEPPAGVRVLRRRQDRPVLMVVCLPASSQRSATPAPARPVRSSLAAARSGTPVPSGRPAAGLSGAGAPALNGRGPAGRLGPPEHGRTCPCRCRRRPDPPTSSRCRWSVDEEPIDSTQAAAADQPASTSLTPAPAATTCRRWPPATARPYLQRLSSSPASRQLGPPLPRSRSWLRSAADGRPPRPGRGGLRLGLGGRSCEPRRRHQERKRQQRPRPSGPGQGWAARLGGAGAPGR